MVTRVITIIGFAGVIAALVALEIIGRRPTTRVPSLGEWLGYLDLRYGTAHWDDDEDEDTSAT